MDRFTEPVTKLYCCNKDWTFLYNCKFLFFSNKTILWLRMQITVIRWFLGASILKDSRDMLLNTHTHHLFLLLAPASTARNPLLRICSLEDIQSIRKAWNLTASICPSTGCHSESLSVFYWIVCLLTRNKIYMIIRSLWAATVPTFTQRTEQNQFTPVKNQNMKLEVLDSRRMFQGNHRHRDQASSDESCCSLSNCCLQWCPLWNKPCKTVARFCESHS